MAFLFPMHFCELDYMLSVSLEQFSMKFRCNQLDDINDADF